MHVKTDGPESLKFALKAHSLDPCDHVIANNAGNAYLGADKYNKAIEYVNRAIKLKSDHGDAYYLRGIAYSWLDDFQAACRDYRRAERYGVRDFRAEDLQADMEKANVDRLVLNVP